MNRFEELFEELSYRARSAADVASRKTNEMVEIGKLKYQAKQVAWEIEKTYSKLGAIVYESKKSEESFEDIIALAVEELDSLNEKLETLEEKIMGIKNSSHETVQTVEVEYHEPAEDAPPAEEEAPVETENTEE